MFWLKNYVKTDKGFILKRVKSERKVNKKESREIYKEDFLVKMFWLRKLY